MLCYPATPSLLSVSCYSAESSHFSPDVSILRFDRDGLELGFVILLVANSHYQFSPGLHSRVTFICIESSVGHFEFVQLPSSVLAEVCCKVWCSFSLIRVNCGQEIFLIEGCRQEKKDLQEMQLLSMLIRKLVDNLEDPLRPQLLKRKSTI